MKIITPLRGVLIFLPPALRLSGALGLKKATPPHIAILTAKRTTHPQIRVLR